MSTEETRGLAAALSRFQGEMTSVAKTKTANAGTYSYQYADLGDIVAAAYPIMSEHGLSFSAKPTLNESGHFVLAYKLMHSSGEDEHGEYPLPTSGTPQQVGSAITYARRYAFTATLGIVSEEDDDGKSAPQERESTSRPRQQRGPDQDAMRRKYHKLRERLGWDEDAGHAHIIELSNGRAGRWSELNATQKGAVLSSMEDLISSIGPSFAESDDDPVIDRNTGEVER